MAGNLIAGERKIWLEQKADSVEAGSEVSGAEEMVQVFMVVRCYSCKTFQVHQVSEQEQILEMVTIINFLVGEEN